MDIDWQDNAKTAVAGGIGLADPVAGVIAQVVIGVFWSSGTDIWSQIRAQVEELVEEKIVDTLYDLAYQALKGVKNNIDDYNTEVADNDPVQTPETWNVAEGACRRAVPQLQAAPEDPSSPTEIEIRARIMLLPLFTQLGNLHLSLLRDAVIHGKSWGFNDKSIASYGKQLTSTIATYQQFVQSTMTLGAQRARDAAGNDNHRCQPFRDVNKFVRGMTLAAKDFADMWPYFDVAKYPLPVTTPVRPTRQIFSDPFGTADDSGGDIGPRLAPDPSTLIVGMRIWSGSKIDGIDIGYDDGAGGVTHTGRMGDQGGGSDIPPQGGRFPVDSGNPITSVNVQSGDVIDGLQFCFKDGSTSRSFGASGSYANIGYSNEMLSSIHVNGTSNFYGSIDCLVFGFQFDPDSFASTQAVQQLYPPTSSS